ncbi:MAG: class I SAM-dependent methyltransferase [Myxococcales bacterium]|nr:class I SAM-dependent methyltransferase [Myxococcales bacterium]MCB9714952.1 class I SAM-dependent methyltransferase [Myxococcales bacterium]
MTDEPTPRSMEIFFEVYEPLPRQGPGSRASAARALALCRELPSSPRVLDLGCGAGGQTLHLAELSAGTIVAIDRHAPSIERLRVAAAARGLGERIQARVGDIGRPSHEPESFDLLWSEGALYNIGIEEALRLYHEPLRRGGYFVLTEAVWRREDPPPEPRQSFAEYAGMGWARDVVAKIDASPWSLVDHFTLPDSDWWDDFYTPMERRIAELRDRYEGDAEALAVLDEIAKEPEMHRQHSGYYGYELFVLRKT